MKNTLNKTRTATKKTWVMVFIVPVLMILLMGIGSAVVTTTLNSPADGLTNSLNNINFKCSALTDLNIRYLTNISLFTNSTGSWVKNQTTYLTSEVSNYINMTGGAGFVYTKVKTLNITDGYTVKTYTNGIHLNTINPRTMYMYLTFVYQNGTSINTSVQSSSQTPNLVPLTWINPSFTPVSSVEVWQKHNSDPADGIEGFDNATIVTVSTTNTYPFNLTSYTLWNCLACDNSSTCAYAGANRTVGYDTIINSITYNSAAFVAATENYVLNITSAYTPTNPRLIYNGTTYYATITSSSGNYILSKTLQIPTSLIGTNTFYFIWNTSLTTSEQSLTYTQKVSPIQLGVCNATLTSVIMNLSMVDEETLLPVNGTIEVLLSLYPLGTTTSFYTYNGSLKYDSISANPTICSPVLTNNYSMSYTIRHYVNSTYFVKFRNVQYMTLSNQTIPQNIVLYNLLTASGQTFTLSITGNTYANNGNLLVQVQKQYLQSNTFPEVESSITNSAGDALAHLIPSSAVYRFIVSQNGVFLAGFSSAQVLCVNSVCSIPLNLNAAGINLQDFTTYGNVLAKTTLYRTTKTITFTFSSIDGVPRTGRLVVYKNNASSTVICNNSLTVITGSIDCVIPTTAQNTSFVSQTFSDDTYLGSNTWSLYEGISKADYYGVDVLIEILLYLTIVLLFMSDPVLMVIGAILGLFFAVTLILINTGNWWTSVGIIMYFVIAGIAVIVQINKKT